MQFWQIAQPLIVKQNVLILFPVKFVCGMLPPNIFHSKQGGSVRVRAENGLGRQRCCKEAGAKRKGGGFPNWYDSGGWQETIHMPTDVA